MKKSYIVYAVALLFIVLLAGYIARPISPAEKVYNVCWKQHFETNGWGEAYCGELQDQYKIEFLCNKTGDKCWTEKNDQLGGM